jgi:hypothetical protein
LDSLGRLVKRGEKGIFILAPTIGKKRKEEETAADPDSKTTAKPACTDFEPCTFSTDYLVICGRALRARWIPPVDVLVDSGQDIIAQVLALCNVLASYRGLLSTNPEF